MSSPSVLTPQLPLASSDAKTIETRWISEEPPDERLLYSPQGGVLGEDGGGFGRGGEAANITDLIMSKSAIDSTTEEAITVAYINFVAYGIVANIIVTIGIIGNILNLIVLTRPKLKGVMYVYLLGLAVSNLMVLIIAVPALMDVAGTIHSRSYTTAYFQAHLELPLLNSVMASSIYIIICMTVNRYISIYKPTHFQRIHTFKNAYIAILFSFIGGCVLHVPLAFSNYVKEICQGDEDYEGPAIPVYYNATTLSSSFLTSSLDEESTSELLANSSIDATAKSDCYYKSQPNVEIEEHSLFRVYLWISEALLRFGPIVTLTALNILIIVRFHRIALKREVLKSGAASQHRGSSAGNGGGMGTNPPPSPYSNGSHPPGGGAGGGGGILSNGNCHHGGGGGHGRLSFSEVNGKLAAPLPSGVTMSTTMSSSGSSSNGTASTSQATSSGATISITEDRTTNMFHNELMVDGVSTSNGLVISRANTPLPSGTYPSSPGRFPMIRGTPQRQSSKRRGLHNPEERMLVVVLIAIVILFVVCTTPAAFLSILVNKEAKLKVLFTIFRAVANNLELLCFALNFFVYCLCSADIRRAFVDVLFENCLVLYIRKHRCGCRKRNPEMANGANFPANV